MWKVAWILLIVLYAVNARHHHERYHHQHKSKQNEVNESQDVNLNELKQLFLGNILEGNKSESLNQRKDLILIFDASQYKGPLDEDMQFVLNRLQNKKLLSLTQHFEVSNPIHLLQLQGLIKLMTQANDWSILGRILMACHLQQINRVLLVNALLLALRERKDSQQIYMPKVSEILPEFLSDEQIMKRIRNQNILRMNEEQKINKMEGKYHKNREVEKYQRSWQYWKQQKQQQHSEKQDQDLLSNKKPQKSWQEWKQENEQSRATKLPMKAEQDSLSINEASSLQFQNVQKMPMNSNKSRKNAEENNDNSQEFSSQNIRQEWNKEKQQSLSTKSFSGVDIKNDSMEKKTIDAPNNVGRITLNIDTNRLLHIIRRRMKPQVSKLSLSSEEAINEMGENSSLSENESNGLLKINRRRQRPPQKALNSQIPEETLETIMVEKFKQNPHVNLLEDEANTQELLNLELRRFQSSEEFSKSAEQTRIPITKLLKLNRHLRKDGMHEVVSVERINTNAM